MIPNSPTTASEDAANRSAFVWQDHGRYVEIHPVETGYLVLWGRYEDQGRSKALIGNRIYPTLAGTRRRLADAVLELTRRPDLAAEALGLLDRRSLPAHHGRPLPDPL